MKTAKERLVKLLKNKYGYLIVAVLASIPLFNNHLIRMEEVHDLYFHLMRIEGIAQGLRAGMFPVKVQPEWYQGYGYGCSVFYGDIFLYIPAFLRLIGVSLQNAYKIFLVLCNAATALVAGYSFEKIFGNKRIALAGSALYTLSIYRLTNVYVRAAVGEHTAMIFFPLLACAAYCLLRKEARLQQGSVLLAIAMTGILQCHIISAEICIALLTGTCLVYIKRVFRKDVFFALVKAVCLCVGINLGFLVPFVDYMLTGSFNVNVASSWRMSQNIQEHGAFWTQLFRLFYRAGGSDLPVSAGMEGEMPLGVGLVPAIALVLFVGLMFLYRIRNAKEEKCEEGDQHEENRRLGCFLSILGMLLLWMSTYTFPWEFLRQSNPLFRYMIINIQFPWRFCAAATVILVMLWCVVCKEAEDDRKLLETFLVMVGILTIVSAGYLMRDAMVNGEPIQIESMEGEDTSVASGEEYLPAYTVSSELQKDLVSASEGVSWSGYERRGLRVELDCLNESGEEGLLSLPLLYYKGYGALGADDAGGSRKLRSGAGPNNVVAVVVPAGFIGRIYVSFQEPVYWRMAELCSLLTVLLFLGWTIRRRMSLEVR